MSLYLGMISGTSMDAIDAALIEVPDAPSGRPLSLLAASATPFEPSLKARIAALIDAPAQVALDEIGQLDTAVARMFAAAALALLDEARVKPSQVTALGSHGQTLRHRPDLELPFTWQLGDPSTLAERTGITVVADFRRRDVAAGGQGAPLAPVFHDQAFRSETEDRVIANLGGIANVTLLTRGRPVTGFDTGPANRLLDAWIARHGPGSIAAAGRAPATPPTATPPAAAAANAAAASFDPGGAWAASGTVDAPLLERLLEEPYLALPPPKSTGRELFNLPWLERHLEGKARHPEDVQATLLEYTALTVARAIEDQAPEATLYVCGGGAHNAAMLAALGRHRAPHRVATTAALGLDPDYVEAVAFAWFAHRTLSGLPANAPTVTGAAGLRILGGVYRHG
jgi:anhydro-N-acetylmuramic acid kinase